MERWINLGGYQLAWLISVGGAAHAKTWPAWAAALVLCGGHIIASSHKATDLRLMVTAAVLGVLLDGLLASANLASYSPATPAVPVSGCPLWILALWLAFSTTPTRSLGWLRGRRWWAALFGAAGGPLAYQAAAAGWGVIAFTRPHWQGQLALALGWAAALVILMTVAGPARRAAKLLTTKARADLP